MPKKLINGELVDINEPSTSNTSSNSHTINGFSTTSSTATTTANNTSSIFDSCSSLTLKDWIFLSINTWGINVPILAILTIMLILGFTISSNNVTIIGLILLIILSIGYSPKVSNSGNIGGSNSNSKGNNGGGGIRTVKDLPQLPKSS